ncbi:hypothetical protein [Actinomycetospora corticicola]|uniref:Mce-associated membrane protein n=1 Tax=Actinomycetospora corticicola TaxID=663602 RepID=A0A7Y9J5C6_9PSEU|nr:hypothetical protein [Actinomycetospora corticicola]NYD35574.1 hypothetical protein [Actinomycetospora corticicola]
MGRDAGVGHPTPVRVLVALGVLLVVAAAVLGVLDRQARARDDDGATTLLAARTHLVDLGAATTDPAARTRAVDGATGAWRDRLAAATTTGSTSTVVRTVGLEDLDGDTARALAVGVVGGDGGTRPFRAVVTLARVDDRWLVADVGELP